MTENLQGQDSLEKSISADDREQFWRSHLETWSLSGLSQAEYCRQNDLNIAHFRSSWQGRHLGIACIGPAGDKVLHFFTVYFLLD